MKVIRKVGRPVLENEKSKHKLLPAQNKLKCDQQSNIAVHTYFFCSPKALEKDIEKHLHNRYHHMEHGKNRAPNG